MVYTVQTKRAAARSVVLALRSPYRFPYNITRDYSRPSHYWRALRHWYERARSGYSYRDLWSLDYLIAEIVIDALPKYKNDSPHHCTVYMLEPDHVRYMNGVFGEAEHMTDEEEIAAKAHWDVMIDEIVDGFRVIYDDDHDANPYDAENRAKLDRSLALFSEYFGAFWT